VPKPSSFSTIRYSKNMGIRILSSNDDLGLIKSLDDGLRSTLQDFFIKYNLGGRFPYKPSSLELGD
jgi:hypothetical protein